LNDKVVLAQQAQQQASNFSNQKGENIRTIVIILGLPYMGIFQSKPCLLLENLKSGIIHFLFIIICNKPLQKNAI
jgi:hypothetical protein